MSGSQNGNWHTANGGGLPLRPPTVDEALPYSPFTSIVPFSPDIIPFPSAEPSAPPTTLTPEQQTVAKKAVDALNADIRGASNTSQLLQQTFHELKNLLNPNDLSQFQFKPVAQLATPPPDSPITSQPNGSTPSKTHTLSPFASMLLKNTDVSYVYPGTEPPKKPQQSRAAVKQPPLQNMPCSPSQPQVIANNNLAHVQNSSQSYQSSPLSANGSGPATRPGPAVVIKPSTARREEYQRFDSLKPSSTPSQTRQRPENEAPTVKSREREIADTKLKELYSLVDDIAEDKETEQAEFFTTTGTDDGDFIGLRGDALSQISISVSKVVNLGCFPSVPTDRVLLIQSVCEPLITATSQLPLFLEVSDEEDFLSRLAKAQLGLRACKLVLQTMTEGNDDRRICSEDLIQSMVRLLKHVYNSCITPIVESRRHGSSSELFASAGKHKNEVYSVLRLCGDLFSQVAALIGKIKLSGFTLSPIESVSMEIIFAQNGEKETDSALGSQKFESFRQKAMDVLAQISASHPDQRDSVTNEILNNLGRLSDTRKSARHFKSARDAPIMLVSALFMRIVQAAMSSTSEKRGIGPQPSTVDSEAEDEGDDSDSETAHGRRRKRVDKSIQSPSQLTTRLWRTAQTIAANIAGTLVARAENVSKTGDKPFRNLLDMFIEDLCNVLGSPEWPAASLFLERFVQIFVHYATHTKEKGVQATDMAIAGIGTMGCGIIDFTSRIKNLRRGLDISQSELASRLVPMAEDALTNNINPKDVLSLNGPYRVVLESLPRYLAPQGPQANRDDPQLQSLSGYYVTSWANAFYLIFTGNGEDGPRHQSINDLESYLGKVTMDPDWFAKEYRKFQDVTDAESQLATGIITLQGRFCKYLQHLISTLVSNTGSHAAKVKSRSMSSLTQLIQKDPQIVDENTFPHLARLIQDTSPEVRSNTVSLISKCLEQNPSLDRHCLPGILKLMSDSHSGPKKKAIKLLKDMYSTPNATKDTKLRIATELLLPVLDEDKPVAELTRQTLEEIWLTPFKSASRVDDSQLKLDRERRVSLLVDTVQNIQGLEPKYLQAFERFFQAVLSPTAKSSFDHFEICKGLVADMVDGVVGTDAAPPENSQGRILRTLSILSKVSPKLFTTDQVHLFKEYVSHFASTEDLNVFQPAVIIFRYIFPALATLQEAFLEEMRQSLGQACSKLATYAYQGVPQTKETLLDVAHCLWMISPLIKGDPPRVKSGIERSLTMICSVACQLQLVGSSLKEMTADIKRRIVTYMMIIGSAGKVCNLDVHVDVFRAGILRQVQNLTTNKKATPEQLKLFTAWKSSSVAVLLLDLILPFTKQTWDIKIREQALCSLGDVCQQKTKHFTRADIEKAFKLPFINQDTVLIRVVLMQFRDFLSAAERRSESGAVIAVGEGAAIGAERLETSYQASDSDHATTHIARSFLPNIISTALGKTDGKNDDLALLATEIIVSISRQGLLHPKECGAALVALSTSLTERISTIASAEHRKIHLQHETMFEKEYVAAVSLAFRYQRDVFGDSHGAIQQKNFKPKMQVLFEAFKEGSRKTLKKFINNLFVQMNFELPKLDATGALPEAVLFTRFCLENFALFDYVRTDEVYHVILTIESIVLKQTGPSVALAIETEMPEQHFEPPLQAPLSTEPFTESIPPQLASENPPINTVPPEAIKALVNDERLHHLTVASMILHMMWETRSFLRRVYNLPGKVTHKDMHKNVTRLYFITGKDLWERLESIMIALDSPAGMKRQCHDLADIINVDKEHAVEDEEMDASEQLARAAAGFETPDEDEAREGSAPTSAHKGRKRKSVSQPGNTPKKPRGRPKGGKSKGRNSRTPEDSD